MDIIIKEEFIQNKRCSIVKNNKKEAKFMFELIKSFKNINTSNIFDKNSFKYIVQEYVDLSESTWFKHLYLVNIMKWFKD